MSFRCQQCNEVAYRPHRVVVERKMVDHLKTDIRRGPHGGHGQQIVREQTICDSCAGVVVEAPIERAEPVEEQPTTTLNGQTIEFEDEELAS